MEGHFRSELSDLGFSPKILRIFEVDWNFSWDLFFENSRGVNLGNYRNCAGKCLLVCLSYCKAIHAFVSIA